MALTRRARRSNCSGRTSLRDAKKAQGVKLGGLRAKGIEARDEAKARAEALRPVFDELAGMSANAIAREFNARAIATPTGGPWSAVTVLRAQRRLEVGAADTRRPS